MLRLLVELYLDQPGHDEFEQARFAQLAIRLVDSIDTPVAARLMRALAPRPDLPRALALHLAQGPLALAGPVLRLSPVLDDKTLAALAEELPASHAAAITARREVSPALAKKLADLVHRTSEAPPAEDKPTEEQTSGEEVVVEDTPAEEIETHIAADIEIAPQVPAIAAVVAEPSEPARGDASATTPAAPRDVDGATPEDLAPASPTPTSAESERDQPTAETAPPQPAEYAIATPSSTLARADYLAASPEDRTFIIARLVTVPPLPMAERVAPAGEEMTEALLEAARNGTPAQVSALVEKALGVTSENAARIVDDPSGQALAVAARALGLSFAVLSRVLFRLHPVAGRSAAEMTRLADMFDSLTAAGAQHLVASWRSGRRAAREKAEDTPSMRSFAQPRPAPQPAAELTESRRPG
ncbi:DUF2336 domain-containing protein [Ancylobacter pratisalsi]|uniref:DUF2336 domain-containing protein n=2 Tax=Ancylobacter pratisalsi TaxID=1745854 RepID=A0A6P1YTU9_9HYPH|nr:DUF2336 domain-containing protein [Ancylobacter pratisalsi]